MGSAYSCTDPRNFQGKKKSPKTHSLVYCTLSIDSLTVSWILTIEYWAMCSFLINATWKSRENSFMIYKCVYFLLMFAGEQRSWNVRRGFTEGMYGIIDIIYFVAGTMFSVTKVMKCCSARKLIFHVTHLDHANSYESLPLFRHLQKIFFSHI